MTTELNLAAQLDLNRIDPALRAAATGLGVLDFDAASLPRERDRLNQSAARRVSDQGWTAPIRHNSDAWIVDRDLPNWERCPDGTTAIGHQRYRFWPVDATGYVAPGSPTLGGEEGTTGPGGACGVNKLLVIRMPFRLDKVA